MQKSHVAASASDAPTSAQLAELHRQIGDGRITKKSLQQFLRGDVVTLLEKEQKRKEENCARGRHDLDHNGNCTACGSQFRRCDVFSGCKCTICGGFFGDGDDVCASGHIIGQPYPASQCRT